MGTFVNKTHEVYQHIVEHPGIRENDLVRSLKSNMTTGAVMAAIGQLLEKEHIKALPAGVLNTRNRELSTFEPIEENPYVPSHSGRFTKMKKQTNFGTKSKKAVSDSTDDDEHVNTSSPAKVMEAPPKEKSMPISPDFNGERISQDTRGKDSGRSVARISLDLEGKEVTLTLHQASALYKELGLIFGSR